MPPPRPPHPPLSHPTTATFLTTILSLFQKTPYYPPLQLKIPHLTPLTMSTPPRKHNFPTPQSLSDFLRHRLPTESFASWGVHPGTKNLHSLWLEVSQGETSISDTTPPVRTLEVVIVRVLDDKARVLIESHQELSNGDVRYRSRPLSEKMRPGEEVEMAVKRAVREELGSVFKGSDINGDNVVRIVPGSYNKKVEERVSVSYPGLPAHYVLHTVDAYVDGLPEGDFSTVEDEEYGDSEERRVARGAVSCKKHFWKWVGADSA